MKFKLIFFFVIGNILYSFASQVDTVLVISKSMNKTISNIVIVPNSYSSQKENYAVLYLLHGAGGNYNSWITRVPKIKEYADMYNIIIVCPDGGQNSWYYDSPIDTQMKYETYISEELIDAIDTNYKTIAKNSGRAISGLSMGGHGAFYLSFKHQDIWGAAGSMSGGLDIRPFSNNWDIPKRLGEYAEHQENWEKNTVINMVYLLKRGNLKLIFDCGIDDLFYDANKRLHKKLKERNIPHYYIERPGNHNWKYWAESIKYQLLFFSDYFKS